MADVKTLIKMWESKTTEQKDQKKEDSLKDSLSDPLSKSASLQPPEEKGTEPSAPAIDETKLAQMYSEDDHQLGGEKVDFETYAGVKKQGALAASKLSDDKDTVTAEEKAVLGPGTADEHIEKKKALLDARDSRLAPSTPAPADEKKLEK